MRIYVRTTVTNFILIRERVNNRKIEKHFYLLNYLP